MILTGIGILIIVVLILVSSPSAFFSPMVTVIGNDLNKGGKNEVSVVTKTDFSDPEQVNALPYQIGKWHGKDYDSKDVTEFLKANVVLLRGYDPETFTQPLFLTIVQSKTDASFHGPAFCFKSQGYLIQEEAADFLSIDDPTWVKDTSKMSMPLDRLVVTRNDKDGQIFERRLVLYFYIKGNQFNSDEVSMIQVQGLVPLQGAYNSTLDEEKSFLSQVIPLMFKPGDSGSQWHPLFMTLTEIGVGGYVALIVLLLIPLTLIVYPLIRRRGISG